MGCFIVDWKVAAEKGWEIKMDFTFRMELVGKKAYEECDSWCLT